MKQEEKHEIADGLLLRRDLELFDQDDVTIVPNKTLAASKRMREEFKDGLEYRAVHGKRIHDATFSADAPSVEALNRHSDPFVGWTAD